MMFWYIVRLSPKELVNVDTPYLNFIPLTSWLTTDKFSKLSELYASHLKNGNIVNILQSFGTWKR